MDPSNPRTLVCRLCGRLRFTPGDEKAAARAAVFTSRLMKALTWKKTHRPRFAHAHDGQMWPWPSQTQIPIASTRLIETGDGVPVNGKETDRGKLWRSDDGGDNWRLVSYDRTLGGRTHYYFRVVAAPDNENETPLPHEPPSVTSIDGGETSWWRWPGGERRWRLANSPGGDNHDMWIDPTNANRMAVANDARRVDIGHARAEPGRPHSTSHRADVSRHRRTTGFHILFMATSRTDPHIVAQATRAVAALAVGRHSSRRLATGRVAVRAVGQRHDPVDNNIIWSSASGSGSVGGIVEALQPDHAARSQRRSLAGPS